MNLNQFLKCAGIILSAIVAANLDSAEPYTRSTYHCLSLYWSCTNDGPCHVAYRSQGSKDWHPAQDLPYDAVTGTPLQNQYRGSIVNLNPGTTYEVQLKTDSQTKLMAASTWSENPKIKKTIRVGNLSDTFTTTENGNEKEGWVLYEGTGSVIDSEFKSKMGISVTNSFVIIRGFTIKRASLHTVRVDGGAHDVIIENCEMTNWGDKDTWKDPKGRSLPPDAEISNQGAGVYINAGVKRVTVQRCEIHHPRYPAAVWSQFKFRDGHPHGAKAIIIGNVDTELPWEANHVIRYNSIYTDKDHPFEDVIGGWKNFSLTGAPGADSDIYCNLIQGGTDDVIEADGGGQNVRIWGNYLDGGTDAISLQSCTVGPVYIFRNVFNRGLSFLESNKTTSWTVFKFVGNSPDFGAKSKTVCPFVGPVYVYHNISLNEKGGYVTVYIIHPNDYLRNVISRNNVWVTEKTYAKSGSKTAARFVHCSFDYDLHNQDSVFKNDQPEDYDQHGIHAEPQWRYEHHLTADINGRYQLVKGSKGYDAGVDLPNFNLGQGEEGSAPDMGVQEFDDPEIVFGTKAHWNPQFPVHP